MHLPDPLRYRLLFYSYAIAPDIGLVPRYCGWQSGEPHQHRGQDAQEPTNHMGAMCVTRKDKVREVLQPQGTVHNLHCDPNPNIYSSPLNDHLRIAASRNVVVAGQAARHFIPS